MKKADRESRIEYIRRRIGEGATQADLAAELGVTRQRVHQLVSNLPLPCRCGCGDMIPAYTPGHRVYVAGHELRIFCAAGCGAEVSTRGAKCKRCFIDSFPIEDLTGRTFGEWTVEGLVTPGGYSGNRRWWCRCSCGIVRAVWDRNLTGDLSHGCHSCGIKRRDANRRVTR